MARIAIGLRRLDFEFLSSIMISCREAAAVNGHAKISIVNASLADPNLGTGRFMRSEGLAAMDATRFVIARCAVQTQLCQNCIAMLFRIVVGHCWFTPSLKVKL